LLIQVRVASCSAELVTDENSVIEATIREAVLSSLDAQFDKHLAQAENIRSIFLALNDEYFENRIIATGLIGRLATQNPAHAMPSVRKAILQLLTELEYSTVR
jgi:FKBP12-rapamycin complex-associated protein